MPHVAYSSDWVELATVGVLEGASAGNSQEQMSFVPSSFFASAINAG
jgi:hypothetical protein